MGNQGHANEGNRRMVEWIKASVLGNIKEVHCFTNRPVWPQGMQTPPGKDTPPASLNWEQWLGTAPQRDYVAKYPDDWQDANLRGKKVYDGFIWRGWWDYGGGALADMACHTMDCMWWALDPIAGLYCHGCRGRSDPCLNLRDAAHPFLQRLLVVLPSRSGTF
jgi:hypothetical protein